MGKFGELIDGLQNMLRGVNLQTESDETLELIEKILDIIADDISAYIKYDGREIAIAILHELDKGVND
jgi:hypothetical protein